MTDLVKSSLIWVLSLIPFGGALHSILSKISNQDLQHIFDTISSGLDVAIGGALFFYIMRMIIKKEPLYVGKREEKEEQK